MVDDLQASWQVTLLPVMCCAVCSGQSQEEYLAPVYRPLVSAFWPGPLTLLLPASPLVAPGVTAGHVTMAVRMPSHPLARALIHLAGEGGEGLLVCMGVQV